MSKIIPIEISLDIYKSERGRLIMCPGCNKPILERLSNGLWRFKYGLPRQKDADKRPVFEGGKPVFQAVQTPVVIYIHGSIRMKCFRNYCNKWFEFNYFPVTDNFNTIVEKKNHI